MKLRKILSAVLVAVTMVSAGASTGSQTIQAEAKTKTKVKITLSTNALSIKEGDTKKITLRSKSVNEVDWESVDTGIATVNDFGDVTGVKEGNTKVKAVCTLYNGKKKTITCKVFVKEGRYVENPKPYQVSSSTYKYDIAKTMYGALYKNCVVCTNTYTGVGRTKADTGYYKLDGKYKTFSYTIGHIDGADAEGHIRIYLDGTLVKEYSNQDGTLSRSMVPREETIDVSNAVQMMICFTAKDLKDNIIANNSYALTDLVLDKGK